MLAERIPIQFRADPKKVILRYWDTGNRARLERIVAQFEQMNKHDLTSTWEKTKDLFENRHRDFETRVLKHTSLTEQKLGRKLNFNEPGNKLLGAYLAKEYSIEAAALFNPSIVRHPNQEDLPQGATRFVLSFRATGEGHISSVEFRQGIVFSDNSIRLENDTQWRSTGEVLRPKKYLKAWLLDQLSIFPEFGNSQLEELKASFTIADVHEMSILPAKEKILEILDDHYSISFRHEIPLQERVIFPVARSESMGIEDLRLVQFDDGNHLKYFGTYTAYNGQKIQSKLLETEDFQIFRMSRLLGAEIKGKGIALFPRKISNKYVALSRQGGEDINIMYSHDRRHWDHKKLVLKPDGPDQLMQLGNCGSPIETSEGWMVLFLNP
jgi:hypothetical protein